MKSIFTTPGTAWGSSQYLFLLMPIAVYLTRDWDQGYATTLLLALTLLYVWRFLILPFRAGLKEINNEKAPAVVADTDSDSLLGLLILTPLVVAAACGWLDGLLVAITLFFAWRSLILPFKRGSKE
jgi:hypothetical protein